MLLVAAQNVATISKRSEARAISFLFAKHAKQQETPQKQNMSIMCYHAHSVQTLNYAPTTFNPFASLATLERRYKSDSRGL